MRSLTHALRAALVVAAFALASPASAFSYLETTDGDLSGNGLAPTALVAAPGGNFLSMTSGSAAGSVDRDYFTFTVRLATSSARSCC